MKNEDDSKNVIQSNMEGKEATPQTKTPSKKPNYKHIGGKTLTQFIKENMPEYMIPTKRLATILGGIFLAVIILALVQLPYGDILKGNLEIKVGIPLPFLDFGIENADELPIHPLNFVIDLIVYLILSYIIDVIISMMLSANLTRVRGEKGLGAEVYKAKKVAEEKTATPQPEPPKLLSSPAENTPTNPSTTKPE